MSKALRIALLSGLLFAAGAETGAAVSNAVIPKRLKEAEKALLIQLKDAGDNGTRIPDETAPEYVTLMKAKWIESNDSTRQGTSIVTRLSAAGKEKVESFRGPRAEGTVNTRPAADYVPEVEMYDVASIAVKTRQARAVYPFDKLTQVGMSLFYPQPEGFPADKDFAATKQGTVGGFNRKAKDDFDPSQSPAGAVAAKLTAINDTKDGVKGVRFVRVA